MTDRVQTEPILLTPEEAARVLRIGRTRLYAFLADGTIRSVRVGHSRRIPVRALEEFVRGLHAGDDKGDQAVTDRRHDVGRRAPHRSRRRGPAGSTGAELLPLPFPPQLEEQ